MTKKKRNSRRTKEDCRRTCKNVIWKLLEEQRRFQQNVKEERLEEN